MDIEEIGWGVVDWIGLAKDKDRWNSCQNPFRIISSKAAAVSVQCPWQ
jgi:hypothetical protein